MARKKKPPMTKEMCTPEQWEAVGRISQFIMAMHAKYQWNKRKTR